MKGMKRNMKKRIFWSFLAVSLCSIIIFGALSFYFLDSSYTEKIGIHLNSLISLIKNENISKLNYQDLARKYADVIGNDIRVTFVNKDGIVLGDSLSLQKYQNHSDRIEIINAFAKGEGKSIRYSETNNKMSIYIAKKFDENTVIRLSIPLMDSINIILFSLPLVIMSLIIAVVIAVLLSKILSKLIIKPILEFSEKLNIIENNQTFSINFAYEELSPIAYRFEKINSNLNEYFLKFKNENNKINIILDKMREGVIILDKNKDVLLINNSAKRLLDIKEKLFDKNILFYTRNTALNNAIEDVINSKNISEINISQGVISNKALRLYISPIFEDEDTQGVVIIIRDVTAIIKAEKIRSEFVANVSHELKTPITSIKGFSELLLEDNIKDDKTVKEYSKIILSQSERLINLVEDILLLSEVESKTKDKNIEKINLNDIVEEVKAVVKEQASQMNISINFTPLEVYFFANKNSIFELLLNLTDNAIKYNKNGGIVEIKLDQDQNNVYISVFDNGIGIPKNDLQRVFERFYRVDKSRSKKSGGTGLGLSIVKHIVELYYGKIDIDSKENEFTKITITLPKTND